MAKQLYHLVGTRSGQIFYSRDEGKSWDALIDCLPAVHRLNAVEAQNQIEENSLEGEAEFFRFNLHRNQFYATQTERKRIS